MASTLRRDADHAGDRGGQVGVEGGSALNFRELQIENQQLQFGEILPAGQGRELLQPFTPDIPSLEGFVQGFNEGTIPGDNASYNFV